MARTIQDVLADTNTKLEEAIRCYREGLTCPKESLNYLIDVICSANADTVSVTCSQEWKPCLTEDKLVCGCKRFPSTTDVIGKCDICREDVLATDEYELLNNLYNARHKRCA